MKSHTSRVGCFFILIGLISLAMFVFSVLDRSANLLTLGIGVAALLLAAIFIRRAGPPPDSNRFSTLRRLRDGDRDEQDDQDEED
jgi:hypothetical protein